MISKSLELNWRDRLTQSNVVMVVIIPNNFIAFQPVDQIIDILDFRLS